MEMEDTLTLDELYLLAGAQHREEHRRNRFAASLKGIDLDDEMGESEEDIWERTQRKAAADSAGVSEEEYVFGMIGIDMDDDDD